MKRLHAIFLVSIINLISFVIAYFIPVYDMNIDLQGVGSAICGFSGTVLGILLTVITLITTLKGVHIQQYKKYGYFKFFTSFCILIFLELAITFSFGFVSFIKDLNFPILYFLISLSLSCFILLFFMLIMCFGLVSQNNN